MAWTRSHCLTLALILEATLFIIYPYNPYIKKELPAATGNSGVQHAARSAAANRMNKKWSTQTLWRCRVGHFFLFAEIPNATTAMINVEKLIIMFIASYVTISVTPFPKKVRNDRCPPRICCTESV
jgi:hypothetical protein